MERMPCPDDEEEEEEEEAVLPSLGRSRPPSRTVAGRHAGMWCVYTR